jgi:hypothetical protein
MEESKTLKNYGVEKRYGAVMLFLRGFQYPNRFVVAANHPQI